MTRAETPIKVRYIEADLQARRFGDRPEWDRVTVTPLDSGLWRISAVRYANTLAEQSLDVYHTATRFIIAHSHSLIGKDREYKRRKDFAVHHLYRW